MITSLDISGFRSFKELHVDRLTRVNLFVGKNSVGKTSILEAVELLIDGTVAGMGKGLIRRDERAEDEEDLYNIAYLFHGYSRPYELLVEGTNEIRLWVSCRAPAPPTEDLLFSSHVQPEVRALPASDLAIKDLGEVLSKAEEQRERQPIRFVGTEATTAELSRLWDSLLLTPEEDEVATALRIVDPRVERLAFLGDRRTSQRIFLKLSGLRHRVNLGSLGDGTKRLLHLTLNLVSAKGGVLLVDEIDTGLHYTVMADMWRLVIETARRLNIQVFATTHSQDCVHALAWVRDSNPELADDVTLHRVEKDNPKTVPYSLDELAIAARHHVEVR